eukprot:gb/GFBE01042577.1/.p1 GENE.gb/GFBE01042577.1/~~gb/GFBE01042577.1/.p1  ORF type:complete len:1130 (+),score=192.57 gb/GFBE01042577.1/:1-3390(+)
MLALCALVHACLSSAESIVETSIDLAAFDSDECPAYLLQIDSAAVRVSRPGLNLTARVLPGPTLRWFRAGRATHPHSRTRTGPGWTLETLPHFRDPTKAWSHVEKIAFLFCFAACWGIVCIVVWCRSASFAKRCDHTDDAEACHEPSPATIGVDPLTAAIGPKPWYPSDRSVLDLFESHVESSPDATALVIPDNDCSTISYAALLALTEALAESLRGAIGLRPGSIAALLLERGVAQVVAVWGVMKAGAGWLPIDTAAPHARKHFLLTDSEATVIIAAKGDAQALALAVELGTAFLGLESDGSIGGAPQSFASSKSSGGEATAEHRSVAGTDMALLIYTSGTSGKPKGVVYDHRHLLHGVWFFSEQCQMNSTSVALLKSPYFWAVIEWEMFPALTRGARLVIASPEGHKQPDYLARTISAQGVTTLMITPQVLDLVLDIHDSEREESLLGPLRHIVTVGEALPSALANRTKSTTGLNAQLHNFYGASESSCAVYTVPAAGIDLELFPRSVPAGAPQPHVQIYVMKVKDTNELEAGRQPSATPELTLSAAGEAGEIFFGGVLSARYWKRDELTSAKFIDTAQWGRLYRTGDLGRWRGDILEVTGRADRQVKIRGVRVEPEEVEAVLRIDGIRQVAAVASSEPSELVAFVSLRAGAQGMTEEKLRSHCQATLSQAYVPRFFAILPELPTLANGKPDLRRMEELATEIALEGDSVEAVDSMGQMKTVSKRAAAEDALIHRCYAFWTLGVLLDHGLGCFMISTAPYCAVYAKQAVQPWSELVLRSIGNDQDLFGFIILGAYQESKPGTTGRVQLGLKDLCLFLIYIAMADPLPQLVYFIFGAADWSNVFPHYESDASCHRWYLRMVLQARVYLWLAEFARMPPRLTTLLSIALCFFPAVLGRAAVFDVCESLRSPAPDGGVDLAYLAWWLLGTTDDQSRGWSCSVFVGWQLNYSAFYVACYYYARPIADALRQQLSTGPVVAAMALGSSFLLGMLMAMFHYPNTLLEGSLVSSHDLVLSALSALLEVGVSILQPALFILAMAYVQWDMSWWGTSSLGCYVSHYYFLPVAGKVIGSEQFYSLVAWDQSGIVAILLPISLAVLYMSTAGPLGHWLLLFPFRAGQRLLTLGRTWGK